MHKIQKFYIIIELTFLKELMLIRQVHQKSVMFATIWYFLGYSFKVEPNVCNRCYYVLMISINLSDIVISNIKADYRCIIRLTGKNEAIKLLQNADLTGKSQTL